MVTLSELIGAIECVQPVLNKAVLDGVSVSVQKVMTLEKADADAVAFLSHAKYAKDLPNTSAGVVLISEKIANAHQDAAPAGTVLIIVKDAYLAHASISTLFAKRAPDGIHQTAVIAPSAKLGADVSVGAYAVIGERAVIGAGSHIGSHAVIGDDVVIGEQCHIAAHAVIAHDCVLGDDVRVHSHASIGSEGFGFAPKMSENSVAWQRIAQLGRVVIGNHVRIGSNTCVDRGAVEDTQIADNVIIDNLVQIAHNVQIGAGTAIAAKAGIAGSTVIGKNCIVGGAVGMNGHLHIADGVTFTGMAMVTSSITEAGVYSSGTPAMPSMQWRRAAVKFRQMGEKH
ncbi:UDP-3-O-(3-hydroxymyristoyl)glucosamine N-acyltransferase [Moraxella caviae]|uniref:UDP-3-O-acylglucosamine N-acyltransferase n=1 Tax=Moraxella caviae TaxID=34060 RepID=A0A1T0A2X1_9GAMM|nr:UDP-3-O-(3-hydroxymyristoyl)glucosamine N-acyltransferase [Moraxella caviae]OOR89938.1 UDP-3-O-(3-hydroxymyristoyl)glucosamine N-acyltransferase [Moraxella caviae]STZ14323.1 UDP-3-O-acylglucosamine N-acyltransferase [Moraxella caviae]